MSVSEKDVLHALREVRVGGKPLAETGRLSSIVIDGTGRVSFSLAIEPAEAAALEPVRLAAERAVKSLPGVATALVSLTADRVASSQAAPPAAGPAGRGPGGPPRAQTIPGVKHIFAVASGKGGVGKSTLACNLALALKAQGLSVGLLDADIYGPSAPRLFGLGGQKPRVISGRILEPLDGYGIQVMSIGFLVEEETAMIWRGPMVMSAITQMLREVAWSDLDALVVDMPPGTGDAQLTMAQTVPLAGAVIVSTPQDLALIDARRGVAMFRKVEVPILGIVENMASFACPQCGHVSHIFGHGGARREAEAAGVPFLGEVPLHMAIRETSDSGRPVVATDPDGPHSRAYREIAARVWERITSDTASRPAPRIVIE
ncbi:Mrp/NBP35 family ATP-binding protein [uncultured Enterovirga sp.]|uniref:Mrp/NBP35 family ATP-binding protein n=1 Tax=uncultured Enterovirga sp. TaxID=2026352 RepID=UPI0035CA759C